jgi:hypothetical protein
MVKSAASSEGSSMAAATRGEEPVRHAAAECAPAYPERAASAHACAAAVREAPAARRVGLLFTRSGDSRRTVVWLAGSTLQAGCSVDRIDRNEEDALLTMADHQIRHWIGYGHLMLAIYLERHAAFEEYCRTHNRT